MDMREKIAKAIHGNEELWDCTILDEKEMYREMADRVLVALREPTKEMIEAGIPKAEDCKDGSWDSGPDGDSYNSYEYYSSDAPQQIFCAMIDAASPKDPH